MTDIRPVPYTCKLSEATLEKAKSELNEDPTTRQQKLDELRDLFRTRPDIKFRQDDGFLLRFLRNKKFDVDRTFKMLVHYYKVRKNYREIFDNFKPSAVRDMYDLEYDFVCPGRDEEGRVVVLTRVVGRLDLKKYKITDYVRAQLILLETLLFDEDVQVNGIVIVMDWEKLSPSELKYTTPTVLKRSADAYLNAMPIRLKVVHFVRPPGIFEILYGIMKTFLTKKISKRIYMHSDESGTLHQHIPSSMLPSHFGGQLPGYDNTEFVNRIMEAEEEFIYNNQFGFLKSPDVLKAQAPAADATAGLSGTFQKLDVS
ncbi:alpha-tocopherol transfer protein-like [Ptychodera flava]|uniref:alpha-tocopherol transfer protein-like n=1 Tax=Ptychodera flava TaxID=63121 RepID=UPI00396A56CD